MEITVMRSQLKEKTWGTGASFDTGLKWSILIAFVLYWCYLVYMSCMPLILGVFTQRMNPVSGLTLLMMIGAVNKSSALKILCIA